MARENEKKRCFIQNIQDLTQRNSSLCQQDKLVYSKVQIMEEIRDKRKIYVIQTKRQMLATAKLSAILYFKWIHGANKWTRGKKPKRRTISWILGSFGCLHRQLLQCCITITLGGNCTPAFAPAEVSSGPTKLWSAPYNMFLFLVERCCISAEKETFCHHMINISIRELTPNLVPPPFTSQVKLVQKNFRTILLARCLYLSAFNTHSKESAI